MMHPIHPMWGRGGSRIFLGGGALVSFSTSTPINHIVFFRRIPVVLENRRSSQVGEGGGRDGLAQILRWFVVATHRVYCVTSTLETFEHLIVCNLVPCVFRLNTQVLRRIKSWQKKIDLF